MTLARTTARLTDPVHEVCEEAVSNVRIKTKRNCVNYVMGHLPAPVPEIYVKYLRHGVATELNSILRREIAIGSERQRVWVTLGHSREYHPFAYLTLPQYRSYIDSLKVSSQRDRRRIKFHEEQYERAENAARITGDGESTPLRDLIELEEEPD